MDIRRHKTRLLATALLVVSIAATAAACLSSPARAGTASLQQLQNEARRTRTEMQALDRQMQAIAQKEEAARQKLDVINGQLAQTRIRLDRVQGDLERQRDLVASRLATMYKSGDYTWFDIIMNAGSLSDAETAARFIREIAAQDRHDEDQLARLAAQVKSIEKSLEGQRQQAEVAQQQIDAQQLAMEEKFAERSALLKDVVAQIKKILSAPELLMKAGGKVTQVTWAQALVKSLNMPMTADNVAAIVAWEMAEGGHWYNTAYYNPLNTTQDMPGATVFNSVGVKAYTSWRQGLEATVKTLKNGYYDGIIAALRRGNDSAGVAQAVGNSPWGTGDFSRLL
jgi:peptidoglycan hydrolase CwlO-like protein